MDALIHPPMQPKDYQDPRWARFLFFGTTAAWLWLVVRLYMASVFLPSGWGKVTGGEWLFSDGAPIQGLVQGALANEATPSWYAQFLESIVVPNAGLFATVVALGEVAAGLGLLVGLLTGVAAFGAVFMSANFVLSGVLGVNPVLIMLGTLLVVGWRNAGWIGLDRWFIPWTHRSLFAKGEAAPPAAAAPPPSEAPPPGL